MHVSDEDCLHTKQLHVVHLKTCAVDAFDTRQLIDALYAEQLDTYSFADVPTQDCASDYATPFGLFLVAYSPAGEPIACGGYRVYDALACIGEVRKMFVSQQCRGLGIGWKILHELERAAAAQGMKQMILETGSLNTAAIRLYGLAGYRSIPSYVEGRREINRAFSKDL